MGYPYKPPYQSPENIMEMGYKGYLEAEDEKWWEMSSEHDLTLALGNSLKLWLLTQDLYKVKPTRSTNVPACSTKDIHCVPGRKRETMKVDGGCARGCLVGME